MNNPLQQLRDLVGGKPVKECEECHQVNEYEIKARDGFRTKSFYRKAESAEALQLEIEKELAFEIGEGMTYEISLISNHS